MTSERRRAYDRSAELVRAIMVLMLMPDEVRSIVSEGILCLLQQEFEEAVAERSYRSLGSYKIMGLHKTQNRRRAYDQNPILHKAISRLYILTEQAQDVMGRHTLELLSYIQKYFEDCTELQQGVSMEDVAAITNRYVEKGSEDVANFLKVLRQEFYEKLHGHSEPDYKAGDSQQVAEIASNQSGMTVKLDLESES